MSKRFPLEILEGIPEEEIKKKIKLLGDILRNLQQWLVFVEDEGLFFITIEGEEYFVYDLLEGIEMLPKRQKEAIELMCLQDLKEAEVARRMGFTKWTTPAQQYAKSGLRKLVAYHMAKGMWREER